ncbi:MAG TPA: hypothetical protein PLT22_10490, partial [Flexilinea sp.]|nr:hypothetical protein [Flexilinea sp.]
IKFSPHPDPLPKGESILSGTASLRSTPRSRGANVPLQNSFPTTKASGRIFALRKVFVFIFTNFFYHKNALILQNHIENKSYGQLFVRFFKEIITIYFSYRIFLSIP